VLRLESMRLGLQAKTFAHEKETEQK